MQYRILVEVEAEWLIGANIHKTLEEAQEDLEMAKMDEIPAQNIPEGVENWEIAEEDLPTVGQGKYRIIYNQKGKWYIDESKYKERNDAVDIIIMLHDEFIKEGVVKVYVAEEVTQ